MNPDELDSRRTEVEQFIHYIFNYYNGRINVYNKSKLEINWLRNKETLLGAYSRNPNTVVIYPKTLYRYTLDENSFKYAILMCIIHELYHQDQDIDYIRMINDIQYKQFIENAVETQTFLHIAYNVHNIQNTFGIISPIDPNTYPDILNKMGAYNITAYHRCTYITHFISILKDIMHESDNNVINIIREAFINIDSIITIIFNDAKFILKNREFCMPIEQLNDIMEDMFFKYNCRGSTVTLSLNGSNEFILQVKAECYMRLYSLLKEC